ncbi:MAG: FAD-dependent oxidoreductase [Erysipelotrichaceae bacterium]|nr:FAD-dependent oxidoreductase [Erysipelotrichaceae bacterium]
MVYDIIIIGSGPAGLTSAIYASRAQKNVLVLESEAVGGLITHSPRVENYPGYPSISGLDLADKFVSQAMDMNVNFDFYKVDKIVKKDSEFEVICDNRVYHGLSVIIATGSSHRKLNLENEDNLVGKGISYCAVCDGPFYANKDVTIIGGGNSALQEAILLSSYCKSVTMIQNLSFLTGEKALIDQVNKTNNIKVIFNKIVVGLNGQNSLTSIILKDQITDETSIFDTESIFVAIGQQANNEAFKDFTTLDENGFIITDDFCRCNVDGIYAAGDCRHKAIRQIVTASSDGAIAALQAIRYIDSLNK